jgi:hypothetical protein
MASGSSDRVEIIQPDTRLGDRERVGGRRHLSGCDKWLEIRNGCDCQVDIVSPPGSNRISLNPGVSVLFKKREKCLPHFIDGVRPKNRIPDEHVRFARSITTYLAIRIPGPECSFAFCADLSLKAMGLKIIKLILFLEHGKPRNYLFIIGILTDNSISYEIGSFHVS